VFDAIGVGVFYQKFSNASNKTRHILHSTHACICHAQGPSPTFPEGLPPRFECRVHHLSDMGLVEPSVKLVMARFRSGQRGTGRVCVQFQDLEVANQSEIAFLQFPYSAMHFIDENSPLAEYLQPGKEGEVTKPQPTIAMARDHVEVMCIVNGTAAATGSGCESRASYTSETIDFGHRFADTLFHHSDGTLCVELSKFDITEPEDTSALLLPQCF